MPINEVLPPHAYSDTWVLVAWIIVGVIAFFILLFFLLPLLKVLKSRPKKEKPPKPEPVAVTKARESAYLSEIAKIEAAYLASQITGRQLHQQLSLLVREYAQARRGHDATVLTLEEIQEIEQLEDVATTVAQCYEPAFAKDSTNTADVALKLSREVVVKA